MGPPPTGAWWWTLPSRLPGTPRWLWRKAAPSMAPTYLAALTDLKLKPGLSVLSEAELELALRRASNRFRDDVHHPVSRVENDSIRLNGSGGRTLHLPARPVDIHSVEVGGTVLVEDVDFEVDRDAGIMRRLGGFWPDGLGRIRVEYSHGWADIPGGIQDAVLEHATTIAMVEAHMQQNSAGSTQESYGAAALIGTTSKWEAAVGKYRLNVGDRS